MSKLDDVVNFYADIYHDMNVDMSGDGFLTLKKIDGTKSPVSIDRKRAILPTKQALEEALWDERTLVHPFAEQASSGLSVVLQSMKNYMAADATRRVTILVSALVNLASSPKKQRSLGSAGKEILKIIKDLDEKSIKANTFITKKTGRAVETKVVHALLRKSTAAEGTLRTCAITFPFIDYLEEAFTNKDKEFNSIRRKDMRAIIDLYRIILANPIIETSDDKTAPYFHTLLKGFNEIASRFNEVIKLLPSKDIEELETMGCGPYELKWTKRLKDFSNFAKSHHHVAPPTLSNKPDLVDEVKSTKTKLVGADIDDLVEDRPVRHHENPRTHDIDEDDELPIRREEGGVRKISIHDFGGRNNYDRRDDRRDDRFSRRSNYNRGGFRIPSEDVALNRPEPNRFGRFGDSDRFSRNDGRRGRLSVSDFTPGRSRTPWY